MTRRIPVKGSDEIAETTTFNEMLARLQFVFDSQRSFSKMPVTSYEPHHCDSGTPGNAEVPSDRQQETIALVMDELNRMSRLVNDLLLLAKAERGTFQPKA